MDLKKNVFAEVNNYVSKKIIGQTKFDKMTETKIVHW
jgi:hypothetical protein